jgi:DNA-binding PadR family transcriptional regulator
MPDAETFLPLTPRTFHILLALAPGPSNGYQIMTAVEEASRGSVTIGPGTLYEALHRMSRQGLIAEEAAPGGGRQDGRGQRYYRCTPLGTAVLRRETERLAADLTLARRRLASRGR